MKTRLRCHQRRGWVPESPTSPVPRDPAADQYRSRVVRLVRFDNDAAVLGRVKAPALLGGYAAPTRPPQVDELLRDQGATHGFRSLEHAGSLHLWFPRGPVATGLGARLGFLSTQGSARAWPWIQRRGRAGHQTHEIRTPYEPYEGGADHGLRSHEPQEPGVSPNLPDESMPSPAPVHGCKMPSVRAPAASPDVLNQRHLPAQALPRAVESRPRTSCGAKRDALELVCLTVST